VQYLKYFFKFSHCSTKQKAVITKYIARFVCFCL
jgi:hypothetical protein